MKHLEQAGKRVLVLLFVVMMFPAGMVSADMDTNSPVKILLKIKDLNTTLDAVDSFVESGPKPSAMLRGMIQGTDWIDPVRAIVLGVDMSGEKPSATLLIPYLVENEDFQATFGAQSREDYYIMSVPPGAATPISEKVEQTLVLSSATAPNNAISVEVAVGALLSESRDKIDAMVGGLEEKMAGLQGQSAPAGEVDFNEIADGLIATFGQLKSMTFGVDISSDELNFATETAAEDQTDLSRLFSEAGNTSRFNHYTPKGHLTYKTRSFDMDTMMGLIVSAFGKAYDAMGFNVTELSRIAFNFTGEAAGSVSYDTESMKIEGIHVLKKDAEANDFVEKVYLPWIDNYGNALAGIYKDNSDTDPGEVFTRLPDIAIDGIKVYGMKLRIIAGAAPNDGQSAGKPVMTEAVFYVTTIGDMVLTAPSQNRMAELITIAKSTTVQPDSGPLVVYEMDMDGYFEYMRQMIPDSGAVFANMPPLGKLVSTMNVGGGRAFTSTRMRTDFIKQMIAMAGQQNSGPVPDESPEPVTPRPKPESAKPAAASRPAEPAVKDANYWIDKGNLVSTYGNDISAVRFYAEALKKDPMNSSAYFNMGVSYGELEEFDKALDAINRAIELNPANSNYYYARGRVYLMAGNTAKADNDFRTAVEMGNTDAKAYLERTEK
ncbi:MAG: tetratricopeptide repeat protein [Desulfobacteraceae bacterium]|nr:tetratricopeptide repeat protein [Desulfobacteraceae bacterium]